MSKYPAFLAGQKLTAALLSAGQWDKTVKQALSNKVNNTLANDSELTGIALGVGTWEVHFMIFAYNSGSATPDIKTQWAFSGTWNSPLRACVGAGSTNTGNSDTITPMKARAEAVNSNSSYGLGLSGSYTEIDEQCSTVIVTVAGTLSLQWAQVTTDAVNATTVAAGSYVEVRQIG